MTVSAGSSVLFPNAMSSGGWLKKESASVNLKVRDLMTTDVATCRPKDSIMDVMEDGNLLDILSQRDVMEYRLETTELEANVLRDRARVMGSV